MGYKRAAEAEAEADPEALYGLAGVAPYAHAVGVAHAAPVSHAAPLVAPAPVAYAVPQAVTKSIETPCTEVVTEHCVDVPIIKVPCEAGTAEIVHHVPAAVGYAGVYHG